MAAKLDGAVEWRRVWESSSQGDVADFELDRGMAARDQLVETLSERENIEFIQPAPTDTFLDAGCGTGVNILRLYSRVRSIVGFDCALGSLERCRKRLHHSGIRNAGVCQADITAIPLPDGCVDKVLCLSVLQYLNDEEVRRVLRELVRVLKPGGVLILHVKNSSSLYWSTLRAAKKLKDLLGRKTQTYYLRPFHWYVCELQALNCCVLDYKSFNVLTLEGMPKPVLSFLQRCELQYQGRSIFRLPLVRRHGADLKMKAARGPLNQAGECSSCVTEQHGR